ncbi:MULTISPECIES: hypothetical protein [Brucella]|uniref:hypothetical protein n=1 Tax=Brucella TaxID=234 RepID=UPI000468EEBC|nr:MULTISPECIES: hypothetical protein [Brucella]KIU68361.1 hypothetical protein TR92_10760 [Brucella anthropi]QNQ40963.1 hypothetical protein IAR37_03805 [Brucella intermedia]
MKIFGKMIETPERVRIPPVQIGVDDDGEPIFGPEQEYPVRIFRNKDGVDWFDLVKLFPHPYYIAVDDNSRVVSMTDDFQESQIAGYTLVGIDTDFGFTFGPGGTVYGANWTGTEIIPNASDIVPEEISRRQFFQQLAVAGIITNAEALAAMKSGTVPQALQAIIDALPTEQDRFTAEMLVIGADTFNRLHALTETVRLAMQWTEEQRDSFWLEASKL